MIELRSESVDDTRAIAAAIAGLARVGDLIVLAGQMGAGKTAFAQGFARSLGVLEPVTSPTYTLVHTYPAMAGAGPNANSITLHHADLYRLEHTGEVDDLALPELLEDDAVMLVEWGDKVDLGPQLQVELRLADQTADAIGERDTIDGDTIDGATIDGATIDAQGDDGATDTRDITVTSSDRRWDLRWERLAAALQRWAG